MNGKRYRAEIDEYLKLPDMSVQDILLKAIECVPQEVLDNFS